MAVQGHSRRHCRNAKSRLGTRRSTDDHIGMRPVSPCFTIADQFSQRVNAYSRRPTEGTLRDQPCHGCEKFWRDLGRRAGAQCVVRLRVARKRFDVSRAGAEISRATSLTRACRSEKLPGWLDERFASVGVARSWVKDGGSKMRTGVWTGAGGPKPRTLEAIGTGQNHDCCNCCVNNS